MVRIQNRFQYEYTYRRGQTDVASAFVYLGRKPVDCLFVVIGDRAEGIPENIFERYAGPMPPQGQ